MSIIDQQIKISNAMVSNMKLEAQELGLGESILINFPRLEDQENGFYSDYQYPNNNDSSAIVNETGLETINNSKAAVKLG